MSDKDIRKQQYISALKHVALGSTAALFLVALFLLFVIIPKNKNRDNGEDSIAAVMNETEFDKVESEAVVNKENAARTFINQTPAPAASGDNREVFRIIEAIPHDACSIFPFLIEWGSVEEYNKRVPIGYEGLMALASTSGTSWMMSGGTGSYYSSVEAAVKKPYLDDYTVPMGSKGDSGVWYRTWGESVNSGNINGYFEYVGEGKGLYYIAPTYVAGLTGDAGIRYRIQAIPRKADKSPQGELYVKDPAYYRSVEHTESNTAKLNFDSKAVISQTDDNYDLSFSQDSSDGTYRADVSKMRSSESGGKYFDYLLCVKGTLDQWAPGFGFWEGGNYAVEDVSLNTLTGKYVRISHSEKTDNYIHESLVLDSGYFRLWTTNDGGDYNRYDVTFKEAANVLGSYCANEPQDWASNATDYYFAYAGEGKGIYSIPFIYAGIPSSGDTILRYKENLIEVTDDEGRYALTSTTADAGKPVYADPETGVTSLPTDYAKVITNIDYFDVTAGGTDNKWWNGTGVMPGGQSNTYGPERGGWVFYPVDDPSEMGLTFLSAIYGNYEGKNSNVDSIFKVGTRIYVKGQKLRYRYYCRNGFVNNEYFKLLCYANNPKDTSQSYGVMIDGVGYDHSKTGLENLANEYAKTIIREFDSKYRIEIEQITLDKLTPDKVRSADLLYIARTPAINGMVANWDSAINANRIKYNEEPMVSWPYSGTEWPLSAMGDISTSTLFTIYDECITKRSLALVVDGNFDRGNSGDTDIEKNITKLYYFMNFFLEARNFKYFMPEMYSDVANENYTKVYGNTKTAANGGVATLAAYMTQSSDTDYPYIGLYNHVFNDNDSTEKGVSKWYSNNIVMNHFIVYFRSDEKGDPKYALYPFRYDMTETWGQVIEGETKLTLGKWMVDYFFKASTNGNLWKILKNRDIDSYDLVVSPLNADVVVSADQSTRRRVIYGDEMDPDSFVIWYEVFIMGTTKEKVGLNSIVITLDDGTVIGGEADPEMNKEYDFNTRSLFELASSTESPKVLDPSINTRTVTITATDTNGVEGKVEVIVIVREAFDLN